MKSRRSILLLILWVRGGLVALGNSHLMHSGPG